MKVDVIVVMLLRQDGSKEEKKILKYFAVFQK